MFEIASPKNEATQLSIAIIGCGKLGTALLRGLISPQIYRSGMLNDGQLEKSGISIEISHIYATVSRSSSLERIHSAVRSTKHAPELERPGPQVIVGLQQDNVQFVKDADVVILGCKPISLKEVVGDPAIREALYPIRNKKILISILGGVSTSRIEKVLYPPNDQTSVGTKSHSPGGCTLIRAIPNIAARIQESMTVLAFPSSTILAEDHDRNSTRMLVDNLFKRVGSTIWIAQSQMNHASALCASALAFYARMIAAAAEGVKGNADGLSEEDAIFISAHAARGACGLILNGEDPEYIEAEVATKGGSTIAGLNILEDRAVTTAIRDAVVQTTIATKNLTASLD